MVGEFFSSALNFLVLYGYYRRTLLFPLMYWSLPMTTSSKMRTSSVAFRGGFLWLVSCALVLWPPCCARGMPAHRIQWVHVLLPDEAHRLKNDESVLYQRLFLGYCIPRVLLLTGTPLQNNMVELWCILHFLDPRKFPNKEIFLSGTPWLPFSCACDPLVERVVSGEGKAVHFEWDPSRRILAGQTRSSCLAVQCFSNNRSKDNKAEKSIAAISATKNTLLSWWNFEFASQSRVHLTGTFGSANSRLLSLLSSISPLPLFGACMLYYARSVPMACWNDTGLGLAPSLALSAQVQTIP